MSVRSVPSSPPARLPDIIRSAVHIERDCGLDGITPPPQDYGERYWGHTAEGALGVRDVANPQGVELPLGQNISVEIENLYQ